RCSVFAKSDLIHLQQKGVPLEATLCGLCDSIARMVTALKRGPFEEPVFLVGGLAANGAIIRSLERAISERDRHEVKPSVPKDYLFVEAIGSALLVANSDRHAVMDLPPGQDAKQRHFSMSSLPLVEQTNRWIPPLTKEPFAGYVGVDVGSTSTKAVVVDASGQVMAKSYLMTAGRPVDAVKEVFRNLLAALGETAHIAGAGVTGSGRYLVGSIIGADLVRNEITAQTRAAAEVDPKADIIEIGGQDSKLVIKRNGVVVEYQMNKACAAGTGSFIDELADMLGISVKNGDFASLAFQAPHTIDLGTRCAAFMGQAVTAAQREGVSKEVIVASLANSIAGNYLSKVVETRKLGKDVILTGAVFYNDAVVSAFKQALKDKNIIVPTHKEVSGAIGAALLAKEHMQGRESGFKGFQRVVESQQTLSTFTCKSCDNNCTITRLNIPGDKPTFYGSRCDLFDGALQHDHVETPFDERERLLFAGQGVTEGTGPTVGIPRTLLIYDYIPMLTGFLDALGVKTEVSNKTNQRIIEQAVELGYSDSCFPVKLAHGHVASLQDVDYVLFPCFIRMGERDGAESQKYSCPLVQASPFIIRQTLDMGKRMLIPIIDLSRGDAETLRNLADVAVKLGFSPQQGRKAAARGLAGQRDFEAAQLEAGKKLLQQIQENNQLGVVLFSRPYLSQDPGANLGIAEKLAQLGVVPIPMDYLPLSSIDVKLYSDRPYWASECKHIAAAAITAGNPLLYGLILTNFGCGPNSFMLNLVEDIMGGKPLGQLEIDEHAAEAGIVTRIEAFVDTIKGFHRSRQGIQQTVDPARVYRSSPTIVHNGNMLLVPRMSPQVDAVVAAMQAYGARAMILP
ncbi:MAG TPA: BadF/BadG/BcrA/BcrD ATPase family protein, partial [Dehalococcoidia bacterium]|nr:BadF/BadG/BcrA/BcrD ATPase family protein [Dehalococcoidia bacterium]